MEPETVLVARRDPVTVVTIDRPAVRNAVDAPTARALHNASCGFGRVASAQRAARTGGTCWPAADPVAAQR